MHQKDLCHCGHDHSEGHAHHEHPHDGECGCGCGHNHREIAAVEDLSVLQQNLLLGLHERSFLPVARFTMTSTKDDARWAVALAPVYLGSPQDSMEQVKVLGADLEALAQGGLITLDYDLTLKGYAYQEYESADLTRYFEQTVREGSEKPGALFDTAHVEKGSMALTDAGKKRVEEMLG